MGKDKKIEIQSILTCRNDRSDWSSTSEKKCVLNLTMAF